MKLLFVCDGNTCRSPLAEGILKKMLQARGITNIEVRSAGIGAVDGSPANPTAIQVARKHHIDLKTHVAQLVTEQLIHRADWVIAMTPQQRDILRKRYPEKSDSILLLKELGRPNPQPQDLVIQDPIGSDYWGYEHSFLEIEAEIERILPYLNG
jgi:protein-tyrosine-phosphatase